MQGTDSTGNGKGGRRGKKPPISAHGAFPAVIALWFAALLGFGSLILPVIIFEKLVVATGIASLFEAAQPPLGTTSRLMIAAAMAIVGAIAGVLIARKVAHAQSEAGSSSRAAAMIHSDGQNDEADAPAKRPISAHEELGTSGLDAPIATDSFGNANSYNGKRRSLAVTDDSGPSDYLEFAPLPGGAITFDDPDFHAAETEDEPLELEELALEEVASPPSAMPAMPDGSEPEEIARMPFDDVPTAADTQNAEAGFAAVPTRQELVLEDEPMVTDSKPAYNPFASNFTSSATSGADAGNGVSGNAPRPFDGSEAVSKEPPLTAPEGAFVPVSEGSAGGAGQAMNQSLNSAVPEAQAKYQNLSMAELIDRFASALQARAQSENVLTAAHNPAAVESPSQPFAAPSEAPAPMVFRRSNPAEGNSVPSHEGEKPAAAELANGPAQFAATSSVEATPTLEQASEPEKPAVPFALRALSLDDADDDHGDSEEDHDFHGLSLSLSASARPGGQSSEFARPLENVPTNEAPQPLVPATFAASAPCDEDEIEDITSDEQNAYSSLLDMKNQFGQNQEFVRIEDDADDAMNNGSPEPVVVFPGHQDHRASPAPDGPSRDPVMTEQEEEASRPRLFDGPSAAAGTEKPQSGFNTNAGETERALREALDKLQRMSGAA